MYTPDAFAIHDRTMMLSIMADHPLALFATNGPEGPVATRLPLMVETDADGRDRIIGHFARANSQWRQVEAAPALAIFNGANGYVTPDWYATKRETGKVVPTWNYVTVQARGPVTLVQEPREALAIIERMTDVMEGQRNAPWAVGDAPRSYIDSMMRGLVTFCMTIDTLHGQAKLSQNKNDADLAGIRDGLSTQENGQEMLSAMDRLG